MPICRCNRAIYKFVNIKQHLHSFYHNPAVPQFTHATLTRCYGRTARTRNAWDINLPATEPTFCLQTHFLSSSQFCNNLFSCVSDCESYLLTLAERIMQVLQKLILIALKRRNVLKSHYMPIKNILPQVSSGHGTSIQH